MTYKNIMVDLETMGINNDAAILSIGAVWFDPSEDTLGPTFYRDISLKDCIQRGMGVDAGTIKWWMEQTDEARKYIYITEGGPLPHVLNDFTRFCSQPKQGFAQRKDLRLWGNGSTFDNVILASAHNRAEVTVPWSYRGNMCFRTLRMLAKELGVDHKVEDVGTKHNALDDAVFQANQANKILRALNA